MTVFFSDVHTTLLPGIVLLAGICVGRLLFCWIFHLTGDVHTDSNQGPTRSIAPSINDDSTSERIRLIEVPRWNSKWGLVVEIGTGLLFAGFVVAMLRFECQQTPEVRPGEFWHYGRIVYQLLLISLLLAATGTDFRECVIPDGIIVPGILVGVLGAMLSGELQIIHLWIDWNDPLTEIHGPYIPQWIREHQHLHGLAWSMAGLVAGGGLTWLVRALSRLVLGQHALGFGDVTLMAMIGSFIGWQPIVVVFLAAPLCGIVVGLAVRLFSSRTFVPYGPYLCAATILVLFGWKWIWMLEIEWSVSSTFSLRKLFGDWPSLAILAGVALTALVLLLGLVRLYRAIPGKDRLKIED